MKPLLLNLFLELLAIGCIVAFEFAVGGVIIRVLNNHGLLLLPPE